MTKKDTVNFEASLQKLEKIIEKLEDGDISLEDSVKSFEEGIGLVKECQKQLSQAELKVKKLLDNGLSLIHISDPRDRTRSRMPSSA